MKKNLLKPMTALFLASALLFSFISKPERSNFSGEWKLNEGKSDLGQFAGFATRTIKTDQKNDSIAIARTAPGFDGNEATSMETLTFDGKEKESTLFGNSKRKATAKWSDDGQTLTFNYTLMLDFDGQVTEVKGVEVWSLTDGGKTLVVQNNSSSSFGDLATKSVYEKK
ncbi:MAG: hypothetical protein WDN26_03110 [Chitinophagaceae bacterium]